MEEINSRFLDIYNQLVADRKVRNKTDFTARIAMPLEYMSHFTKNRRELPQRYVVKLNEAFNVNPDWLLTGKGERFKAELPTQQTDKSKLFSITPIRYDLLLKVYSFSLKFPDGRIETRESKVAHEIIEIYRGGCCYFLGQYGPGIIAEIHE